MTERRYTSTDPLVDFIQQQWAAPETHPFFLCIKDDGEFREHVRQSLKATGAKVNDEFLEVN